MSVGRHVRQVIESDNFNVVGVTLQNGTESQASNPPKTVDAHFDCHDQVSSYD
jgi:hypothetical protein